ncbi:MAG: FHA domain-containing protein [Lachnospiraceae bacterium]|nr:FHA domain-containing protein [Lachnospiraceae bacterium]
MGKARYENQGTNTYLVYEVDPSEEIDTLSLGMLTNNKIPGLAAAIYTQMNTSRFIKYNVSSKISAKQIFSGVVNKKRLIGVFQGIVRAMMSAEDYMLDPDSILLDLDYIFADVSSCETVLICYPVGSGRAPVTLGAFFKEIMFTTQFDQTENCDHVARIINYLNSTPAFSPYEFGKVLNEIASGPVPPVDHTSASISHTSSEARLRGAGQTDKGSSQGITPDRRSWQEQSIERPSAQPQNMGASPIQLQSMGQPPEKLQSMEIPPEKPQPAKRPPAQGQPVAEPMERRNPAPLQASGVLIPGQPPQGQSASGPPPKPLPETTPDGKKIGLFYLLQHYNKENAELYRAQKAAKKEKKKLAESKTQAPVGYPAAGAPVHAPIPETQSPAPEGYIRRAELRGGEQSVNVRGVEQKAEFGGGQSVAFEGACGADFREGQKADFGETVFMGDEDEDKTMLSADLPQMGAAPRLVRSRNYETILIDRPVFRIGKERNYVDYWVNDNALVSRSHANIITREGRYFILDTNSTNHTYINGNMIQSNAEVEISHGDRIRLGNEEFEFKLF